MKNKKVTVKPKITEPPIYKHRGVEYKPFIEWINPSAGQFKIWHEMYMVGTGQFVGAFNYSHYTFPVREDFERAVNDILDRGRQ